MFQNVNTLLAYFNFYFTGAGTGVPFHFHGPGFGEVVFGRKVAVYIHFIMYLDIICLCRIHLNLKKKLVYTYLFFRL